MSLDSVPQSLLAWWTELIQFWPPRAQPGWPMALAVSVAVGLLIGAAVGPRMGVGRSRLGVWLAALLFVPAFTWTIPRLSGAVPLVWEMCDKGTLPRPSMIATGFPRELTDNVLLLVPAGAAAVLWPVGARRLAALLVALAVSPVIEAVQLIPSMHRGCQVGDVVNNSIGVVLGFAAGAAVESLWRSLREVRTSAAPRTSELAPAAVPPSRGVRIRGRDA